MILYTLFTTSQLWLTLLVEACESLNFLARRPELLMSLVLCVAQRCPQVSSQNDLERHTG